MKDARASHRSKTAATSFSWKINSCVIPNSLEDLGEFLAICPGTLGNLISFLPRNPPEPCLLSAPEPSGTLSTICTATLRNLISHLHLNPPEPHQQSAPEGSGTLRNLLRNLVLQLHRIAPELFWAKDPIASFAVGEKSWKMTTWRCRAYDQRLPEILMFNSYNNNYYIYLYIYGIIMIFCGFLSHP